MTRFRLFGRSSSLHAEAVRATAGGSRPLFGFGRDLDPPTDPYGFPPVLAPPGAHLGAAVGQPGRAARLPAVHPGSTGAVPVPRGPARGPGVAPTNGHFDGSDPAKTGRRGPAPAAAPGPGPGAHSPDPAEAAALAAAFAADYLSWDEDDPARRGRVLLGYLRQPVEDPTLLGWSGRGRQRVDFALPGLVRPDGDTRVLVDVRVRVTPYRSVGGHAAGPDLDPDPVLAGVAAAAPAPAGRGWRGLASCWVRLSVPVTLEGGRLVVDAWEESLELAVPPVPDTPPQEPDHALDGDDPCTEARSASGAP